MTCLVGLENNFEGRSLAWALEHPGCFAYGASPSTALSAIPLAIQAYVQWVSSHHPQQNWLVSDDEGFQVVDTWDVYTVDDQLNVTSTGDYEVNAWFKLDWIPLTEDDIEHALQLLEWSRLDLLEAVRGLDAGTLNAPHPGERWSISGILQHVAGAEWWYLDRLGAAFPRAALPEETFQRLQEVRTRLLKILPDLAGSKKVLGLDGEFWSPRKLVRRAVWHERDHTAHILKLR